MRQAPCDPGSMVTNETCSHPMSLSHLSWSHRHASVRRTDASRPATWRIAVGTPRRAAPTRSGSDPGLRGTSRSPSCHSLHWSEEKDHHQHQANLLDETSTLGKTCPACHLTQTRASSSSRSGGPVRACVWFGELRTSPSESSETSEDSMLNEKNMDSMPRPTPCDFPEQKSTWNFLGGTF